MDDLIDLMATTILILSLGGFLWFIPIFGPILVAALVLTWCVHRLIDRSVGRGVKKL